MMPCGLPKNAGVGDAGAIFLRHDRVGDIARQPQVALELFLRLGAIGVVHAEGHVAQKNASSNLRVAARRIALISSVMSGAPTKPARRGPPPQPPGSVRNTVP